MYLVYSLESSVCLEKLEGLITEIWSTRPSIRLCLRNLCSTVPSLRLCLRFDHAFEITAQLCLQFDCAFLSFEITALLRTVLCAASLAPSGACANLLYIYIYIYKQSYMCPSHLSIKFGLGHCILNTWGSSAYVIVWPRAPI